MVERLKFDIVIIGSGISGLSSAITAAENGLNIAIISKEKNPEECNTFYAQGGIAVRGENDSPELFSKDIQIAGDNLNYTEAVKLLVKKGPDFVKNFLQKKIGIDFSKNDQGEISLTMEAAHSVRRIYHVNDMTGAEIEKKLLAYAKKLKNIKFFSKHIAIDFITNTHNSLDPQERYKKTRIIGVYIYNEKSTIVNIFFTPTVILASGGIGNLYLHTSNPPGATGDGIAMAYRIGLEIINMEYIQFHPTILFHRDIKRFLISESIRGEGARLINKKGEYFMEKYLPIQKDLAPRDEVSRAIFREMETSDSNYVMLDPTLIDKNYIIDRFPGIYHQCKDIGIDITNDMIPVVPAAHYSCGGIKVNLNGRTSLEGLYAVGETSCTGVHGANRLASSSLLEGLVFGILAGKNAAKTIKSIPEKLMASIPDWIFPKIEEIFDPLLLNQDMHTIQSTMWNYAGIIRNRKRLIRALADLNYLSHRIQKFYQMAKINRSIIELRNSILTAIIIVKAASINRISRGCHYIE